MKTNFDLALEFVLKWEGHYSNDSIDPGGETNFGISKRAYPDVDIKSLTLNEAGIIYRKDYWDKVGGDNLDKALAIAAFDTAVNCGVSRARAWMQELDGKDKKARLLIQRRLAYYLDLVKRKPAMQKYIKGWLNRTNDLSKYIDIV